MKKKIALYIPTLNGGGAERVMLTLANSLAEKGILIDLVLNKLEGPYIKDISKKVNIVELKTSRAIASIIPLAQYINNNRPDTILSAMNYINVVTIMAKTLSVTNTKVIISEHSHLSSSLTQRNNAFSSKVLRFLMKISYPYAEGIVAVSNSVADDLVMQLGISRKRITTIYNPIVSHSMLEKANNVIINQNLLPSASKIIISVGRLVHEKNFSMLIKAFNKVQKQIDSKLLILGEGYAEAELKLLVEQLNLVDKVKFIGFVDNPYVWMKNADLLVLSSNYEGFGNVLVEAMACGTPVISTNCPGGPYEILEGGKWGELVAVGNDDQLSNAIITSLTNPSHISSDDLKKRASKFSVENAINKYLDILV